MRSLDEIQTKKNEFEEDDKNLSALNVEIDTLREDGLKGVPLFMVSSLLLRGRRAEQL